MWNEMILKSLRCIYDHLLQKVGMCVSENSFRISCTFGSKTSKEVKFWEKVKINLTSINNSADILGQKEFM